MEGGRPQRRGLYVGLCGGGFAVAPFSFGSFSFGGAKENERSINVNKLKKCR